MSISPYQYQLLNQSFTTLKPNFHCFCVSFYNKLKQCRVSMTLPESDQHVLSLEYRLQDFMQQCLIHLPRQHELTQFLRQQSILIAALCPSVKDISTFCNSLLEVLKLHLGSQFTLAVRNAWKRALHVFANIIKAELFGISNVVQLDRYRNQAAARLRT
ncbi:MULTISPECIES: globin [unclassified Pseudoalteromonas]|uniref:globin n=1 Tax=unclassified Pseudoalteromonas TaxID=194690 RepID=UPI002096B8FE|nr:globin [Pseudoalteromonas sp. XMcav2-N]MCO7190306.1 globin [Pseudoalteromonas sp. XMcav2-N]